MSVSIYQTAAVVVCECSGHSRKSFDFSLLTNISTLILLIFTLSAVSFFPSSLVTTRHVNIIAAHLCRCRQCRSYPSCDVGIAGGRFSSQARSFPHCRLLPPSASTIVVRLRKHQSFVRSTTTQRPSMTTITTIIQSRTRTNSVILPLALMLLSVLTAPQTRSALLLPVLILSQNRIQTPSQR